MKKTKDALHWIVWILRKHKIPFQITGGFAANIYWSKRPLADIDIDLPDKYIFDLLPEVKKYIVYWPKHFKDWAFDLLLVTLDYKWQEIDLGWCSDEQIYNKKHKRRENLQVNFSKVIRKKVFGLILPIISREELIKYKSKNLEHADDIASLL
jgi:hypothetical protein